MTTGLAIVTMNRPHYCADAVTSVLRHLDHCVDHVVLVNDGSAEEHSEAYEQVHTRLRDNGGTVLEQPNGGVAKAKNAGLQFLLDAGCDWLFTMEDDLVVRSSGAVKGYLTAAQKSGWQHLMYALHGPANALGPKSKQRYTACYQHCVGAWCLYSRESLETCGLMDEAFRNAHEHIDHSMRLALAGFTVGGPGNWPDAINAKGWLKEQPGSIQASSIRPGDDHNRNIDDGLRYWQQARPDTFDAVFGEESPLHEWALGRMAAA